MTKEEAFDKIICKVQENADKIKSISNQGINIKNVREIRSEALPYFYMNEGIEWVLEILSEVDDL